MFKLLSALALLSLSTSCVAIVAAGAAAVGYIKYSENEASMDFEADLDETWKATIAALRDLQYKVDENYPHGTTEGEIDLDDRDTNVKVELHPEGFTRVRVRVGTFETEDHKRKAGLILEGIQDRL